MTGRLAIRTVPGLQHDEDRAEDLDTDGEDHVAHETLYACLSRPWIPLAVKKPAGKAMQTMTLNDLWATARPRERRIRADDRQNAPPERA